MSSSKILCLTKHNGRKFYVNSNYIMAFTRLPASEVRQSNAITELKLTSETVFVVELPVEILHYMDAICENEMKKEKHKELAAEEACENPISNVG